MKKGDGIASAALFLSTKLNLVHVVRNFVEGVGQLAAQAGHRANGSDSDESGDQAYSMAVAPFSFFSILRMNCIGSLLELNSTFNYPAAPA